MKWKICVMVKLLHSKLQYRDRTVQRESVCVSEMEYRLPACPHLWKCVGMSSHTNYNTSDNLASGGDELMIFMVL